MIGVLAQSVMHGRAWIAPVVLLAAWVGLAGAQQGTPAPLESASAQVRSAPPLTSVAGVSICVSDLDASVEFYTRVLTFEVESRAERSGDELEHETGVFGSRVRTAELRLGDERIELREFLAPQGRPVPVESRSNDRWFQHIAIVVGDLDGAYAHLRSKNVRHASAGPQVLPAWNTNASGIGAFYFKDPDNHVLEVIHFPPGKGDARWQTLAAQSGRLFLGVDHTAIVVGDTGESLRFYQGVLGMRIAGGAENYGIEQERLNNVFGARVRITALRAPTGPGVELLEYLAPGDGRPYPIDSRDCDLWQWHTLIVAPDPGGIMTMARAQGEAAATQAGAPVRGARSFDSGGARWISPGVVNVGGSARGALRDPDGHAIVLMQPPAASRNTSVQGDRP